MLKGLLSRQRDLEAAAIGRGREKFERRLQAAQDQGRGATYGAAKRLLSEGTSVLIPKVQGWIDDRRSGPGRPHAALEWIERSGADVASYITMLTLLHHIYGKQKASSVARALTDRLALEWRARMLEAEAPGLFNYKIPKLLKSTSVRHMKFSLAQTTEWAGIDVPKPTEYQRVQVGLVLLDLARHATGLYHMESEKVRRGRRVQSDTFIYPTEETVEWLEERNDILAGTSRYFGPLVVPPRDWARGERGGYLYGLRDVVPLVSTWDRTHADDVEDAEIPVVYRALNRLQRTPWRINRRVYGAVLEIMKAGGGEYDPVGRVLVDRASVPAMEPVPMPAQPTTDPEQDGETWRLWRREASHRKETEKLERREKVRSFWYTLSEAKEHLRDNAIFFVWALDFRGRMYPVGHNLSPQGSDLSRGLLEFYDGVPLGSPEAADALALHGANVLDEWEGQKVGTMTRQERVELIDRLTPRIVEAAEDPLANRWWEQADKPLMFLSFCFEWAGYQQDGLEHVSRLPVHVDGSCNGVQHMAAMVRDTETAKEVNVTANSRPHDLYDNMAQHANHELALRASTEEDERVRWVCQQWVKSGLVTRKACKRPTMTFGYGGTRYGYTDQIREYFKDEGLLPSLTEMFHREGDEKSSRGIAFRTLAGVLYEGLEDVVPGAFTVRNWLQGLASDAAQSSDHLRWIVPGTNFPVHQRYNKADSRCVDTILSGGVRLQPRVAIPTDEPDIRRHVNGIAPNYVHSLDAAHLALTVDAVGDMAVNAVHDSFGCHAARMPMLEAALRGTFLRLYTGQNVLELLRDDLGLDTRLPQLGSLDLSEVRASNYFFV